MTAPEPRSHPWPSFSFETDSWCVIVISLGQCCSSDVKTIECKVGVGTMERVGTTG